jgi:cytidylate kinase
MNYITIDGPAGSGKSSVASELARKICFYHLNTGAIYRAVALLWIRSGMPNFSKDFIYSIEKIRFYMKDDTIFMNDLPIGDEIRTLEVGKVVSKVAEVSEIREIVTRKCREIVRGKQFVVEGRDIGTIVLPDAFLKIFLTASVEERAGRRYRELISKGIQANFEDIIGEIKERDRIDSTREVAPLKPAEDAVIIKTDGLSLDEVVERVYKIYVERIGFVKDRNS